MSRFRNIFRALLGDSFQTYGGYGNSYYFDNKLPILIDTNDLMVVYEACPHLRLVIQEKAKMFSNMEIKLVSVKDEEKEIESHPILDLLRQPNVLQNTEEFLKQYSIQNDIFANNFVYKLAPTSTSTPKALWNLPSGQMKVVPTGKLYKQTKLENIIDKYTLCLHGTEEHYKTEEVIYTTDNASYIVGISKIPALQVPISNIIGALKTRNVIINDRGAMGILSSKSGDTAGGMPLSEKERTRIEKEYQEKYGIFKNSKGLNKSRMIITNTEMKWEPMSFPTKDLMLFEEVEEDFATILGAYGVDRDIFPSVKGATFENKSQALKSTYQNTIQPLADSLMRTLSNNLGLTAQGLKLIAEYDWLPIMQEDEVAEANEAKIRVETLSIMLRDGVISHEEYARMAEVTMSGNRTMQSNTPPKTN